MTDIPSLPSLVARHSDRIALVDGDLELTWGQLSRLAAGMAVELRRQGVNQGDRVALVENNRVETAVLLPALVQIGAVAVLMNPRLPATALAEQAARTGCRFQAVLSGPSDSLLIPALPKVMLSMVVPAQGVENEEPVSEAAPADQPATIMFTSGSSAAPKAVLHSLGNHYYSALGSNRNLPVQPGDRWLLSLHLFHVGGLGILFRCLLGGGTVVLPDRRNDLAAQISRDRITHLSLVPTQLRRLLAKADRGTGRASLKAVLLGGGPIPDRLLDEARESGLPVCATYGLTEMASQVATASPVDPATAKTLDYRELRIASDGELQVRGKTLFLGYVDGDRVECPFDNDGWFATGDIGRLDSQGGLTVIGRKDNMFVSGGENIPPEQIEQALCQLDGIDEAIVVPVEDAEFGRRPVAFLRCHQSISLSEYESGVSEEEKSRFNHESLSAELEKTLPRFMLPAAFYPWPQGYQPSGLKADRAFFESLAARLHRTRS